MNLDKVPTVVFVVNPRLMTRRMRSPSRFLLLGLLMSAAESMPWTGRRPSSGYSNSDATLMRSHTKASNLTGEISGPGIRIVR
jgi:hypothetical protein